MDKEAKSALALCNTKLITCSDDEKGRLQRTIKNPNVWYERPRRELLNSITQRRNKVGLPCTDDVSNTRIQYTNVEDPFYNSEHQLDPALWCGIKHLFLDEDTRINYLESLSKLTNSFVSLEIGKDGLLPILVTIPIAENHVLQYNQDRKLVYNKGNSTNSYIALPPMMSKPVTKPSTYTPSRGPFSVIKTIDRRNTKLYGKDTTPKQIVLNHLDGKGYREPHNTTRIMRKPNIAQSRRQNAYKEGKFNRVTGRWDVKPQLHPDTYTEPEDSNPDSHIPMDDYFSPISTIKADTLTTLGGKRRFILKKCTRNRYK